MPQEIRNCVYQGKFNTLIFELNKNAKWRKLFGELKEDPRMKDLEFILRFFALNSPDVKKMEKGAISLKKYLNEYMGSKDSSSEVVLNNRGEDFTKSINFIYKYFGENAFFNLQTSDLSIIRKRFYPTIFDSVMIATSIALKKGFTTTKSLEYKRIKLLKNPDYRKAISEGTMKVENIHYRINLALQIIYEMKY